jgi:hypothetical protein
MACQGICAVGDLLKAQEPDEGHHEELAVRAGGSLFTLRAEICWVDRAGRAVGRSLQWRGANGTCKKRDVQWEGRADEGAEGTRRGGGG